MFGFRKVGGMVEQGGVYLRKAAGLVEQEVYLRTATGLKLIHSPGSAIDIDVPLDVYGAGAFNGAISVQTGVATATVTGGEAPYTYLWQRDDGPLGAWIIISPTAAATAFRCNGLAPEDVESAQFTLTVTDSRGAVATSSIVTATATNYGGLNPGGPIP